MLTSKKGSGKEGVGGCRRLFKNKTDIVPEGSIISPAKVTTRRRFRPPKASLFPC